MAILVKLFPTEFSAIREELDRCNHEKKDAVINQNFERAAAILKETVALQRAALKPKLLEMGKESVVIEPDHILIALADLGYDGPITT